MVTKIEARYPIGVDGSDQRNAAPSFPTEQKKAASERLKQARLILKNEETISPSLSAEMSNIFPLLIKQVYEGLNFVNQDYIDASSTSAVSPNALAHHVRHVQQGYNPDDPEASWMIKPTFTGASRIQYWG